MSESTAVIRIATRGSALALAQANMILAQCREVCPERTFELRIIKTTGDKLQTASMARPDANLPKGLFTKELEVALVEGQADLAVHSLKDLPTELPEGLVLGAVGRREDPRDVLIVRARDYPTGTSIRDLRVGAVVATSSTRRAAQVLALRPELHVVEIRGNVATRLRKLADKPEWDATLLAAAGLKRLHFEISPDGRLRGEAVPEGILAAPIEIEDMIPCVGQAAIGIEVRAGDAVAAAICERLNHPETFLCVTAERAFLRAMGGGCQSPIAAYAVVNGDRLHLRAVSFRQPEPRRTELEGLASEAVTLGEQAAARLS